MCGGGGFTFNANPPPHIPISCTCCMQANMASCQEAEGRVRQLEAELDVAKKECNDLEHQVAKVCDECGEYVWQNKKLFLMQRLISTG